MSMPMPKAPPKMKAAESEIRGTITRLFCNRDDFSAGIISTNDGELKFSLEGGGLECGQSVRLLGAFEIGSYGKQFVAVQMMNDVDRSHQGLKNWLEMNKKFKHIGKKRAGLLVDAFGVEWDKALVYKAQEMAACAGVDVAVIENIRREWLADMAVNEICVALAEYDLTHGQIKKLVARYGEDTIKVLEENPYTLVHEIAGYGFKKVDDIAKRLGFPKDHPGRVRAGIMAAMDAEIAKGSTCTADIWTPSAEVLGFDNPNDQLILQHSCELIACRKLIGELGVNTTPMLYAVEGHIAEFFKACRKPWGIEYRLDFSACNFNEQQAAAAQLACVSVCSIITGGAGVGKTYVISALARNFEAGKKSVALAAPTGKAARRMEQLGAGTASTIHRLLGFEPGGGFFYKEGNPLPYDVVIIDEASMLDVYLMSSLVRAIDLNKTSVIFVGDHNQLPPVGPGYPFRDLIKHEWVPVSRLTEVVRQSGCLKRNCVDVLDGKVHPTETDEISNWFMFDDLSNTDELSQMILQIHQEILGGKDLPYHPITETQVLTPQKSGELGTHAINVMLQHYNQCELLGNKITMGNSKKRPTFYVGDKVIQTVNDYGLNVMNGTIGYVTATYQESMDVLFEGESKPKIVKKGDWKNLQLAYALTIHKSQGSEFPCVILVCHKSHNYMHHRNLFYTGVTRSKETTIVLGDKWGIRTCAKQVQVDDRKTMLPLMMGIDT